MGRVQIFRNSNKSELYSWSNYYQINQGMPASIRSRTFYHPLCCPKIQRLKYTKLKFSCYWTWVWNMVSHWGKPRVFEN